MHLQAAPIPGLDKAV